MMKHKRNTQEVSPKIKSTPSQKFVAKVKKTTTDPVVISSIQYSRMPAQSQTVSQKYYQYGIR